MPKKIQVKGGKVKVGDTVYLWRTGYGAPALIRKKIVDIPNDDYLIAVYEDSNYQRLEHRDECYAYASVALRARPDLAIKREHALIRQGRIQGKRLVLVQKAA